MLRQRQNALGLIILIIIVIAAIRAPSSPAVPVTSEIDAAVEKESTPKAVEIKPTAEVIKTHNILSLDATYYSGKTTNTTGASGNKLSCGKTVALDKTQMNNNNLGYGDTVYIDWPKGYNELDGEYTIEDCGCPTPRIDIYYCTSDCVPPLFRRIGVVPVEIFF